MLYRLAADLLALLHLGVLTAVVAGPWLPAWVHSGLVSAIIWGLVANRGRCRVTQWEYQLRRHYCPRAEPRGLVRRLVRWTIGADIGEGWATALTLAVLVLSVAARVWK